MWLLKFDYYNGKSGAKAGCTGPKIRQRSSLRQAAVKGKENEVGTAAHAELAEQVRNVKLHSAFRNVELAGDFLVGEVFQQRIKNFLFAAAQVRDGIGLQAAALAGKDGIHKSGEKLPGNPESAAGNEGESAGQLIAGHDVGEKSFHAKTQERKTVGIVVLVGDDDEAGIRIAFENIGQERAGCRFCRMSVNHVNLSARRLESAEVGRESGFQQLDNDLEIGLC